MRDRLIEMINNYPCMSTAEDCFMESISADLADYLLGNGVIVPPCKVGDKVYVIFKDKIHNATIYSMNIETEQNHYLFLVKVKVFDKISMFKVFIFGNTVFLTKEEAEQALKGEQSDGLC